MSLAEDILPQAVELINTYGSDMNVQKASSQSYNPLTQKVETVAGALVPIKGTFESYSSEEIKGLIEVGDVKILTPYVEGQDFALGSDVIIFNGTNYNIINIEPLYLQNQIIIYSLQVRR